MDDQVYQNYLKAGKIAAYARDYGIGIIKPGLSFLELAETVESKIVEKGAGIAFPVNIAVNDIAAHYSPFNNDSLVLKHGDVVKLDVGAHIDGYIADTAVTVEIGSNNYGEMIKASEDALDAAIGLIKPGVNLSDVGKKIEETINSYGFKPVDNLTGHSLEYFNLHSGMSVPNVKTMTGGKPKEGDVLAVEPFATNGIGHVYSGKGSNIYICNNTLKARFVRDSRTKMYYTKIKHNFKTLPFAQRWCEELFPTRSDKILRRLAFLGITKQFPQLIEDKDSIVTQKEHTVIVTKDGCEVTTVL